MNENFDDLMYQAGLTAQGCWDEMDSYDREAIMRLCELIVRECANRLRETDYELVFVEDGMCDPSISDAMLVAASDIEEHFGIK